ncbi:hypothetical protein SAMN05421866_4195 [Chryseobacterium oranimense]|uniref:Uncharacterized protein n=1 Tax=Chryseobacterium oranimense TaxID=421058 RepID=A0A1M5WQU4_9FLAO|nr:hypothetical protein [Chryseobacterium oranimense]SHH89995.1 hypothetical protein SAMN05421866_4195 [Chryseobacterium oranimense]
MVELINNEQKIRWEVLKTNEPPLRTKVLVSVKSSSYNGTTTAYFNKCDKTGDIICVLDVGGCVQGDEIIIWANLPGIPESLINQAKNIIDQVKFDNDFKNLEFDYTKGDWITNRD